MVIGLERFRDYFRDFQDQYIIIGGTACDVALQEAGRPFRRTKDLDVVLILESYTPAFGRKLREFISEGRYRNHERSDGKPQAYRFDKPQEPGFPQMIELLCRSDTLFDSISDRYRSIPVSADMESLSAIIMDDGYYQLLEAGKSIVDSIPMLSPPYLILLKAKAWLNLMEELASGTNSIDRNLEDNIRKHIEDVIRLAVLLPRGSSYIIDHDIYDDLHKFMESFVAAPPDLKKLNLGEFSVDDIVSALLGSYTAG
ncbi:MAG: hypothetical protein FWE76_04245 [Symbiobacteriaceae bacterium]|nr:hypothetical protein [Symbiobacteriaceae bacterium]